MGNGACFVNSIVFGTCSEKDKFVSCFCFSLQGNFHTCNSSTPSPSLCCCWKTGKEEERKGRREGGREGGREGEGEGEQKWCARFSVIMSGNLLFTLYTNVSK